MGIDPEYFLDEMSQDELVAIYKAKHEANKSSWEQTRLICYYNFISQNGTEKIKKPSDIFSLEWDKQKVRTKSMTSKEAQEKLKEKT